MEARGGVRAPSRLLRVLEGVVERGRRTPLVRIAVATEAARRRSDVFSSVTKSVSIGIAAMMLASVMVTSTFVGAASANTGGSISLNGTSQYMTVPASSDWALGTGDFTIEWFQYQTNTTSMYPRVFSVGTWPASLGVSLESGSMYVWLAGSSALSVSHGSNLNQWVHFAVSRSNSTLRVFRNGTLLGSAMNSSNISNSTTQLVVGSEGGSNTHFGGSITNFHIVKGTALYTSAFTPSGPVTAVANSKLLLNAQSSATLLADSSGLNKTVTGVGSPTFDSRTPFPWPGSTPTTTTTTTTTSTTTTTTTTTIPSCTPTLTSTGRYTVAKFTNTSASCDYDSLPDAVTSVDVLLVGGGGGAGAGQSVGTPTGGGGGGAAQLLSDVPTTPSSEWSVLVGAGGAGGGGSCCSGNEQSGSAGGATTFGDVSVAGGQGSLRAGLGGTRGLGGTANVGGVAGGNGGATTSGVGGNGGNGTFFGITGTSVCYGAGGGAGGVASNTDAGGSGGCGVAATTGQISRGSAGGNTLLDGVNAQNATHPSHNGGDINRGHGGGGANGAGSGGTGGPGVVYVRYAAVPTVTGPASVTRKVGTSTTLSVSASAGAVAANDLTYQWRRNGVAISGATSSSLALSNLTVDDTGSYDVVVTNSDGSGKSSSTTSSAATVTVEPLAFNFKINSLTVSTTNRTAFEVGGYTGDDRGGMAISTNRAFLLGDSNLAAFDHGVTTLNSSTVSTLPYNTGMNGMVSDVRARKAYMFNYSNTTGCGAVASPCFTTLTELHPTTGALTSTVITLSSPIPQAIGGTFFAGYGRVVYRNGSTNVVYNVDLPTGDVTNMGTRAITQQASENDSNAWGVAEYFDGDLWLSYSGTSAIRRTNVRTGATEVIVNCTCSDLASFVVDPSLNRWYFHWEGSASSFAFGSDETFGYASATFETLPAVSITPVAALTNANSAAFNVQFDDAVTGIAADDFTLSGTSTGWTVASVTAISSSRYTVTVSRSSGTDGTVVVSMRSGAGSWTAGGGTAIPSNTVNSTAMTVDRTVPTATFSTVPAGPLSASSTYAVTFGEAISGLTSVDFSNAGTAAGCVFTLAASSGTTINVAVTGCGDGTLVLQLAADAVTDAAGNTGPASTVSAASRYVDGVSGAPVLSFSQNPSTLTNSSTLTYTVTSNEPVSGLTASDISNVGTATGCVFAVSGTEPGTTFTVTATGCGSGTVQLRLASGAVSDGAGNTAPTSSGTANTVDRTISSLGNSLYAAISPDGTRMYVSDNGGSSVRVVNLQTNAIVATVTVGSGPRSLAVTPNGSFVYVANASSSTVSKISTATNTVVATISVGTSPNGLEITPDGSKVVVGNSSSNSVSIISTATDTVTATVGLGNAPWGLAISPDGLSVYTANYIGSTVSHVSLSTNTLVRTITVGSSPYELVVSRSGDRVYVSNYGSNTVSVIATATHTVVQTITGLSGPMGIVTSLDDATVYVADFSSARVRWFDSATYTLNASTIAAGSNARGLELSADGSRGFVANQSSGSVTIFHAASSVQSTSTTVDRTVPTATFSTVPAGPLSASSTYAVTFGEAISGLTSGDFSNAGTAAGCVFTPAASSGTTINVAVTGCGDGTLVLQLAADAVTDAAGNTGPASAVSAASRYVDGVSGAPVLSFSQNPSSPSNSAVLAFTLTANEPVSGLTASDISNVGSATGCVFEVSGTQPGTTFTVTATSCGEGTVRLRLANSSVTDGAGLAGPAASGTANTFDRTLSSMGSNPMYSAVSPDGTRLYVTDTNSAVRVVNLQTYATVATITVGSQPRGVAVTPDGNFVYVANYGSRSVSKISTATNTVVATISNVGTSPNGLAITPDGSKVVVANYSSNSLAVIQTSTDTLVATVPVGANPWTVAVTPDSQTAYVSNLGEASVAVVNLATNNRITTLNVGSNPYELTVNRAGDRVYVSNYSSNTVSVINTATVAVIQTVTGVSGPMGMVTSLDDTTVYVVEHANNRVRWFDASTYQVNASVISVGANPWGIRLSPDGSKGFVNNYSGSSVTVFNAASALLSTSITVDRSGPTATFSTVPAGPLTSSAATYTLTFNEAVSGLAAADFSNTGTATGCSITPAGSTGVTINVVVSGCSEGTVVLELASGAVTDSAGNTGPASAVAAASRFVDGVPGAPILTFTQNPTPRSTATTLTYTLTASEPVSGLTASDFSNVASATGCVFAVSGTQPGTTFTVTATGCGEGMVQVRLANGAVTDAAGVAGPVSAATVNTVDRTLSGMGSNSQSVAHPDGTRLYVPDSNSSVRVVDLGTFATTATITVANNPRALAITPDGAYLYVSRYGTNLVSKIDTATNTVVGTITVGTSPVGVAVTTDGTKVVVANHSGQSVSVIDTATDTVIATIALGRGPWNLKLSPDGRYAYTANVNQHSVSVVDLLTNTVTGTVSVGAFPHELDINPAGTLVYVPSYSSNNVSVISTATNTVVRTVTGLSAPMAAAVSLDGTTVYVTEYNSARVRWFDASTYAINASTLAVGSSPHGLSMSADGSKLFVNNNSGQSVTILNTQGYAQSRLVLVDRAGPSASFSTVPTGPLTSSSTYAVTFTEAVVGLAAGDFSNTGTATGCVFTPAASSGTTINVAVTGCGDGTLVVELAADSVTDIAGNTGPTSAVSAASGYVDGTPGAPVLSFSQSPSSPSNSASLTFTLTSNEPVSGLTASDISNVGTATGCVITVSGTEPGTTFTVTAASCGEGTVQLRLANASVADGAGNTAPVSSGTANTVSGTISSLGSNYYSAIHPNGTRLYVADSSSSVRVVNTTTNAIVATITVGSGPRGVAVTPSGDFVYVANYSSNTVSKISTTTNTVVGTISVGTSPNALTITPDGSKVLVSNVNSNSLSIINTSTDTVAATIALGRSPWSVAVSPNGGFAYTGNYNSNTVSVVNLATNTVVNAAIAVGSWPYELTVSRSGDRVFVSNYGSGSISVIDTATNTVSRTVAGISDPMGIITSVDDQTVYVVQHASNRVRWFDGSTYAVNGSSMVTGTNPWGISMTSDGSRAYVSNYSSASITAFTSAGFIQSGSVTIDRVGPTATFSTVPSGVLTTSSTYAVTFNEAVSGLAAGDFSNAGTATGCVFTPASASGTTINVAVTSCGDGTLVLELAADSVTDAAGNSGPASAVTAASRYVDAVAGAPVLTFAQSPSSPNNSATLSYTLTANEPVSGLTASDISNIGTATGCVFTVSGTQPGASFTVAATGCSEGTVQLRLANASVTDGAGNAAPASAGAANTFNRNLTGVSTTMYSAVHPNGSVLYVSSQGLNQVRVVDLQTFATTATINVGSLPRGIAVTPDGNFVYVANYSSNSVSKISTSTNTVVRTINVGSRPIGLAITPDGTKVVVANYSGASVTIINTVTDTAGTTLSLGRNPWNVKVSPDSRFAYTGNVSHNSISVINLTNNTVNTHIAVGSNPYELGINRSGTRVYSANFSSNSVSVIDTSNFSVIRTVSGLSNPMDIATSVDDTKVYVVEYGGQRVRWFDSSTYAVSSTASAIAAGSAAWGMSMSPDGSRGFVSNYSGQTVTVFNAEGFVQSTEVQYDATAPTLSSFSLNTSSPNDLTEQTWTLRFSESVTGLDAADFVVGGTSTGWSSPVVSGSGSVYTVSVSNESPAEGTVTLSLRADAVADAAGNTGPAVDTAGANLTWRVGQGVFRIETLTANNVTAKEVGAQTGDDRGGIALTTSLALLTGDAGMGRFNLTDLNNGARAASMDSTWMDAIVTDVKTLKSYAFNLNAARNGSLTTLTLLDAATGLRTSTVTTLSSAIPVAASSMMFSGYGRVAIWTGGRLYDISLPSGQVTNYGAFSIPAYQRSENWAAWGVVEYFGGQLHLAYVSNNTTISRINVATRAVSTVYSNPAGFSDMASFTVQPRSNRWYFHYEARAGAFSFGSDETLGFADATFNVGGEPAEPVTNLSVSTRSSTAVLTWDAPTTGPTPTDYVIQSSTDSGATWRWESDAVSSATTASLPGFTPGAMVRFRVATVSGVNSSSYVTSEDSMVSPFATAPTITSVTTANQGLRVAFTAPASPGASAIRTYEYSVDGGTTWVSRGANSTASPLDITGLVNGTEYPVIIRAINTQGAGEASNSVNGTPTTTPGAPTIVSASPTASGTLTVAFTAPSSDGGTPITNYQYSLNNGSTWVTRNPASTSDSLVITGLSNGTSYNLVLRAVNARGTGANSATFMATAGVPAGAPTISSISSGDATINAVFSAPSSTGGLTILNYEYSVDGGTTWTARTPASTVSPLSIAGLTNGTSYTVSIRAVNAAGSGAASASRSAAPSRTPDAPTIDSIEPSSQRLRVSYTAPAFDGGVAVTNYQFSVNDGATWTTLSPVNTSGSFSITGLNNAQQYQVRIRAVNARGAGAASAMVAATPATTPGAPVISSIAASNQTLSVAFTAGATGGAVPVNYEFSLDDGGTWQAMSPATTSSPLTITGLTNGTSYPVRIRAVNAQGAGAASAASDATPATVPSAPTIASITGSDRRISVAVTEGFNGGAAVTNYEYSTDNGATWTMRTPASPVSPIVIAGLVNATDYDVRVRAVNAQGAGAASVSVSGRPVTVPDAPTITSVAGSPGTLTVAFTAPAFNGGAAVTNYEHSVDGGMTWTPVSPDSTSSPIVMTGLTDGTTYPVRIRAVNAQGGGASSAMVEGVPENAPGAPTITSVTSANQSVVVAFSAAAPRGLVVTTYQYSIDGGTTWVARNPDSTSSPMTITGLVNGTTYPIKIRGVNARGAGLASEAVDGLPSTPPGAPTITSVTAGSAAGTLSVVFSAGSTGGSPITQTQYSLDDGSTWTNGDQATTPITISGLTNGVSYQVKLRHVNLRGAGVASAAVSGTPLTTPGAPTLSLLRGSDGTITAFVVPPTFTGGTPITNYEYFVDQGGNGTWVAVSPTSTTMPIVITQHVRPDDSDPDDPNPPLITESLVNGATYQVKVRAVNARGAGAESEMRSVKPSRAPDAPTITSITPSDSQLSVVFTDPASDGGEAVTNYQYSIDDGQTWTTRSPMGAESPLVITGLTNGTDYTVRLRGVNVQGPGAVSAAVVARPAGAPTAPTIAAVTSANGALSVYFAQGFDNGAATSNVEYSIDGTNWVARNPASTASPITISGLTNGTSYPVRLRLVNVQGPGAASAATNATPATTPGAPTISAVTSQDSALSIAVSAGSTGGAAITGYDYSVDGGSTWISAGSSSTTIAASSLVNGTTYQVVVRAVNRMGAGTASTTVPAVPSRAPDAPTIAGFTSGNGRVTATFTEGFDGGDAATNVAYSLDGGSTWTLRSPASAASPIVISGLTNGAAYDLRLAMVNTKGNGAASAIQVVRAATTPEAPTIASIQSGNRMLDVSVTAPTDDGGNEIDYYEYTLDGGTSWTRENSVVATGSFDIMGLANGTTYSVRVRAVNDFGAGATSTVVQATPATVPSMPVIVSTTPGNEEVELAFALGPNGGSSITGIEYSINDGATWTTRSPQSLVSPLTITGLQNGVTYPIKVRAINQVGAGVASRTSGTPATVPSAPTINRIAAGNGSLVVEFEPPTDNGGALITNYAYRIDGGAWVARSAASVSSPLTITGLQNGVSYDIEIAAVNDQVVLSGAGTNAVPSGLVSQTPGRSPGAPVIAGSTVSDGTINIGFTVPDSGGRVISAVQYSIDGGDSWTTELAAQSPITVQGLANGTGYSVRLRAVNSFGVGVASAITTLTPARAPFAPVINAVTRSDSSLSIAFQLGGNGGDAITDVEYSVDGGTTWLQRATASTASPIVVTGLVNGALYPVKVRAVNTQGSGDSSLASNGMPAGIPAAPTIASLTRANGAATVSHILGAANGATITNLEYSVDGGTTWVPRTPASVSGPWSITGLSNGSTYGVQIRAVNEMGVGPASTSVSVTPATTPSAPTVASATGEDGRAVVAFAPNGDGGDAITNYAFSIDGGATWTTRSPISATGPLVVGGLTNGTSYQVALRAINSVGQSVTSNVVSVMPSGPPTAPTITSVTGSNQALAIAFTAGGTGGAAITAYEYSVDNGSTWTRTTSLESPLSVTDLVNGAAYLVRLRAVNARGTGAVSNAASGTPATVPAAPLITEVRSDDQALHVAFTYGDNGGSAINNVQYSVDNGVTWVTRSPASTARPLTIPNLVNGTVYQVQVRAVNGIGASEASTAVDALPATLPGAPEVTSLRSGDGQLDVHFDAPLDDGGAAVRYYQYSLDGGATWADSVSNVSPLEIAGLTVGTEYTVSLRAVNLRGAGASHTYGDAKTVTAPPAAPTITDVQYGDSFVSLRYVPPTDTGGTELDRFYYSLDGGENWELVTAPVQSMSGSVAASFGAVSVSSASASTRTLTVMGLSNGTQYSVAVRGAHPEAIGLPSDARMVVPSTTPGSVSQLVTTPIDQGFSLTFGAPGNNGGATIDGYEYSIGANGAWFDVPQNPHVVTGLSNGTPYVVRVRAVNLNGPGTISSMSVTPATTASVPRNVAAVPGLNSVRLTWDAPASDGGAEVTDYVIEYSTNNGTTWSTVSDGVSTVTDVTISSLSAGVAHIFRVTPVNSAGRGAPSLPTDAVRPLTPVVPTVPTTPAPSRPVARPVVQPAPSQPVLELLPGSGGIAVAPGEAAAVINEQVVELTVSIEETGVAVVEQPGEFVIRITPRDESGNVILSGTSAVIQALQGRTVEFGGEGFAPNSTLTVWLNSTPIRLGDTITDGNGAFWASFVIPEGVEVGEHTLTIAGVKSNGEAVTSSIGVVIAEEPDDTTDNGGGAPVDPEDSSDGSGGLGAAGIAGAVVLLVLLAGAGLWLVRRRRDGA